MLAGLEAGGAISGAVPPAHRGPSVRAQINATPTPYHRLGWGRRPDSLSAAWFNAATAFGEA